MQGSLIQLVQGDPDALRDWFAEMVQHAGLLAAQHHVTLVGGSSILGQHVSIVPDNPVPPPHS